MFANRVLAPEVPLHRFFVDESDRARRLHIGVGKISTRDSRNTHCPKISWSNSDRDSLRQVLLREVAATLRFERLRPGVRQSEEVRHSCGIYARKCSQLLRQAIRKLGKLRVRTVPLMLK